MPLSKNRIARHREAAAERQGGRCCYCDVLMCRSNPEEYAARYGLRRSQVVWLTCTAEHLVAQQDGGRNSIGNIAAACRYCNQTRHRRKRPLDPIPYRQEVARRVEKGKWHGPRVFDAGLMLRGRATAGRGQPHRWHAFDTQTKAATSAAFVSA